MFDTCIVRCEERTAMTAPSSLTILKMRIAEAGGRFSGCACPLTHGLVELVDGGPPLA